jgi:hypothetical protein
MVIFTYMISGNNFGIFFFSTNTEVNKSHVSY